MIIYFDDLNFYLFSLYHEHIIDGQRVERIRDREREKE